MTRILRIVLFGIGVMLAGPALAGDAIYPDIPKPLAGKPHPEGNTFMRVNHMDLLRHDRDLTVRDGERDTNYSLAECLTCHAVNGPDAEPVSIKSEQHFCRVCHDFAAVKVDCFQCHNSKPDAKTQAMLKPDLADPNDIAAYLKEAEE